VPDLGVSKGVRKAVQKGVKGAKVVRPGELAPALPAATAPEAKIATPVVVPTNGPVLDNPVPPPAPGVAIANAVPPKGDLPPDVITDATAKRISEARLVDYSLDQTYQPNFDVMRTTDDIKAAIADRAAANAAKIDVARRGTITHEELRGLADDLDVEQDVVKKVLERESGGVLNPETILASRQVLTSSADRLTELANQVHAGKATDMERLQFRRQLQFHGEFQAQFMGARAEAGRALNAFAIPQGFDNQNLARVRELVDTMYGDTDKLAEKISQIGTKSGVNKFARGYKQSVVMGSTNELFINSILSGPRTHLVNVIGNGLMQTMNAAETAVAARLGRFLNTDERVQLGEASALMQGTLHAWKDALRLAARAFKTGKTLDQVSKFEIARPNGPAISGDSWLGVPGEGTLLGRAIDALAPSTRPAVGKVIDTIGTVVRVPTERVMAPADEFFKTMAYRADLERQALLHVQQQIDSGAIQAADAERVAREFMENTPVKAQQAAESYAKYVTFQNPLGTIGSSFQRFARSAPALSLIVPFIRTPTNIFKAGLLDRSPVAFFTRKFYQDLQAGGRTRDMALARVGMGSATAAMIAHQVTEGNVSGGGPRDPSARQLLETTGWKPYSVRDPITGNWHSYARMEPWASVVGATADTTEIMSYIMDNVESLKDENQIAVDTTAAIIAGIANNTMSKTFMKGMSDFTEMLSDPGRYSQNWTAEMATAIVPYSALRRQIAQWQDPYMREAWTLLDKLYVSSGIPGWSEDAPPRRDIWGDPRPHKEGSILGSMSPIPDSKDKGDYLDRELVRLMQETRQVPVSMPGKSVDGMRLTTEEYDDLVRLSRQLPVFDDQTLREKIAETMEGEVYERSTPDGKVALIKDLVLSADDIARTRLHDENPSFAERYDIYEAKKRRLLGQ
jgi:hypothetical protein